MRDGIEPLIDESLVEPVLAALTAEDSLAPQSLDRFADLIRRFGRFIAFTCDVEDLRSVTPSMTAAFVRSPSSDGDPTSSVLHLRRTAVRICFRVARDLGLADGDPTLDLELPAREPGSLRPLTDEEVTLCRFASVASLDETRLPAAWALVEATARTPSCIGSPAQTSTSSLDAFGCPVPLGSRHAGVCSRRGGDSRSNAGYERSAIPRLRSRTRGRARRTLGRPRRASASRRPLPERVSGTIRMSARCR